MITQADMQNIFKDKADLKYTNLTNSRICSELLKLLTIEKLSKTNAHTLFTTAKTMGFKKASQIIQAAATQQTEVLMEEDTCKVLMLHNARRGKRMLSTLCFFLCMLLWLNFNCIMLPSLPDHMSIIVSSSFFFE